jgi:hypothetical protein
MGIIRIDALREDLMDALNVSRGVTTEAQVRSGTNSGITPQGTLLAQLTGNASAWGVSSNGVLTSNAITADASADNTGTAGHYQLNTTASVFLETGLIAPAQDGVTIDNPSIVEFQTVQMSGTWDNTAAYDDGI